MKTSIFSSLWIAFCFLLGSAFTVISEKEGVWNFEAPNAPYGYHTGEIHIDKTDEGYELSIVLPSGKIQAKEVKSEKDSISCKIDVDGMLIPIDIAFTGDEFTGEANSPVGVIKINGKKKT